MNELDLFIGLLKFYNIQQGKFDNRNIGILFIKSDITKVMDSHVYNGGMEIPI